MKATRKTGRPERRNRRAGQGRRAARAKRGGAGGFGPNSGDMYGYPFFLPDEQIAKSIAGYQAAPGKNGKAATP